MQQSSFDTPIDSPGFLNAAFSFAAKERRNKKRLDPDNISRVAEEEWDELSLQADVTGLQDSFSIRNVLKAKRIANLLIDEKGALSLDLIKRFIQLLKKHCYFLGAARHFDHKRNEHILKCLIKLDESKEFKAAVMHITKPSMHKIADEIIKRTLGLPLNTQVTDAHARRAALSSWFTYLRQAVGSCFATAPALIVHDEQPLQFFRDLSELFATGKLKRTFGGEEYTVPLCFSSGKGGLNKPLVIYKDLEEAAGEIADSPGILSAVEGSLILTPEIKETRAFLTNLVKEALSDSARGGFGVTTTAEFLLRKMLLIHFKITEEDVAEYENRPKGMVHGGLMIQVAKGGKGKGELCSSFLTALEGAKWGFKTLAENALLRVWEYTLASFAETRAEFSKWNLYSSLGFQSAEEGGIGECLSHYLQRKLEVLNREVENYQIEYEGVYAGVMMLESRIRHAASEDEARWIRMEYQARVNEMNTIVELRDRTHGRARRCAGMFDLLISSYIDIFPKYFQEVYDPEIGGIAATIYDDTPAGFRLIFKHGRTNSSLWTQIHNHNEFIECLAAFFIAAERELASEPDFKGAEQDLSEITSSIVQHIRSERFIETAFFRMARAHGVRCPEKPLEHLNLVEKKPWVYTSGGNFITMTSVYFSRDDKPTTVRRWVENPMELLVFLADNLKKVSYKLMEEYIQDPSKSFLMFSPTHAFLLKPGLANFKKAWDSNEFTFTWIRDQVMTPQERFVDNILLNQDSMAYLARRFAEDLSSHHRHLFLMRFGDIKGSMSVRDFRRHILFTMEKDRGLMIGDREVVSTGKMDAVLYEELPLFPVYKLKERVGHILAALPFLSESDRERALQLFDTHSSGVAREVALGAKRLFEVVSGLVILATGKTSFEHNVQKHIREAMEREGYAFPSPMIFADTNWTRDMFAFVVNPGTGKTELWRVDDLGLSGEPMSYWNMWLNGSRKEPDWGVFINPIEYRATPESDRLKRRF